MPETPRFIIVNLQTAYFFKQIIQSPHELLPDIHKLRPHYASEVPIVLPIPQTQQFDQVPIVHITHPDAVKINIARTRLDVFVEGQGPQQLEDIQDKFSALSDGLLALLDQKSIAVKRIGIIARFFHRTPDANAMQLISNFFAIAPTDFQGGTSIREASLKMITNETVCDCLINNLTQIEGAEGNVKDLGSNLRGILITRDINTVAETDYNITGELTKKLRATFFNNLNLEAIRARLYDENARR